MPRWTTRRIVPLLAVVGGFAVGACAAVALPTAPPPARSEPLVPAGAPDAVESAGAPTGATVGPRSLPPPAPAAVAPTAPTPTPTPAPPPSIGPPESAPRTPVPPRRLELAFTGDALWHSPLWRGAQRHAARTGGDPGEYDFTPMLAGITPILAEADLAICHLETPIHPEDEEPSTYPYYGVPPETVTALAAAGHHRCSTASNHVLDRGVAGIDRTLEVLDAHGVGQHGMARTPGEIEPSVFVVADVTVAHLSYTDGYNGLRPPSDQPWRSALLDPDRVVADARRARDLGAEVVIVSLHWGVEGRHEPSALQREQAAAITASGAVDLIVGHHAHVLQPIERVGGVWVVFGLGNIISNLPVNDSWPAATQDAAVVRVGMTVDPDGTVSVDRPVAYPTWVDIDADWIVRPVLDELARDDLPDGLRRRLETSLERTRRVLGAFLPDTTDPGSTTVDVTSRHPVAPGDAVTVED